MPPKPGAQPGVPPHIAAGLKEPQQFCECKAPATAIGFFKSVTGGDYEIQNGCFLCDQCAQELAAIDPDVEVRPLRPEPERVWEVLA
jgi:hypothetical protein